MHYKDRNKTANTAADQERKMLLRQLSDMGIQIEQARTRKLSELRLALNVAQQMEGKLQRMQLRLTRAQDDGQAAIAVARDWKVRYEHMKVQRDQAREQTDHLFAHAADVISKQTGTPVFVDATLTQDKTEALKKEGEPGVKSQHQNSD